MYTWLLALPLVLALDGSRRPRARRLSKGLVVGINHQCHMYAPGRAVLSVEYWALPGTATSPLRQAPLQLALEAHLGSRTSYKYYTIPQLKQQGGQRLEADVILPRWALQAGIDTHISIVHAKSGAHLSEQTTHVLGLACRYANEQEAENDVTATEDGPAIQTSTDFRKPTARPPSLPAFPVRETEPARPPLVSQGNEGDGEVAPDSWF